MKYLLDTCVISEYTKPNPNGGLHAWLQNTDDVLKAISVVSLGEIQSGISRLPDGKRRHRLQHWLENELVPRFESRILSVDLADTLRWGVLWDLEKIKLRALLVYGSVFGVAPRVIRVDWELPRR